MFEAKGTVKLETDSNEREHTFHFRDEFGGDLEKAKAHLIQTHPGIKNVRVRLVGQPSAPKTAPATAETPVAGE